MSGTVIAAIVIGFVPLFVPILMQIHHLDLGFYEKHFPEYLGDVEREHMATWHRE